MVTGILLNSNNKTYSLESIDTVYETKMTSNIAPAPLVASASSEAPGGQAFKAFSGSTLAGNFWATVGGVNSAWIQINYGQSRRVSKVKITARASNADTQSPKDFEILGSNDGINFTLIKDVRNQVSWSNSESRVFEFDNKNYKIYRINVLSNNGAPQIFISGIEYGYVSIDMNQLPYHSSPSSINYSQTALDNFDSMFFNKFYILSEEGSKNSNGLWTAMIDRKPLSIGI